QNGVSTAGEPVRDPLAGPGPQQGLLPADRHPEGVQIAVIFGANILEHIFNLCRGDFDFLERLPESLLLYIISFLELEDIARLSQVSHRFKTICNSDTLWEKIVQNLCGAITPEMRALAQEVGWKQFFFTNKLQLQLQLRRRRQKQDDSKKSKTK
uniref:F-box protein 36 n=1 Tax=Chelydra serpentina TaxID=8475 RepID=A0A8C3XMQ0_CHESE